MAYFPHNSWHYFLSQELNKEYFKDLNFTIDRATLQNILVLPPNNERFTAYELTPLEKIKVVILGQDPYHGPNQANGLAFSVHKGIAIPPSLRNIYKELNTDIADFNIPEHGSLVSWAEQGVFLLNTALSVEAGKAASHSNIGWQHLTDATIREINEQCEHIVFILWGGHAQKKRALIDESKHHVIASAHPSPLSSYRGFFGSRPFSKTNEYLVKHHKTPINWHII